MITFKQFLSESITKFKWKSNPKIGWWRDKKFLYLYHGTHESNLDSIMKSGIKAPIWVSMALEPNTAHGYAAMGGEAGFRAAGAKAKSIPENERIVIVAKIPMSYIEKNIDHTFAGNMERFKLMDKSVYDKSNQPDSQYYALTELRFKHIIPSKYIIGYMKKK